MFSELPPQDTIQHGFPAVTDRLLSRLEYLNEVNSLFSTNGFSSVNIYVMAHKSIKFTAAHPEKYVNSELSPCFGTEYTHSESSTCTDFIMVYVHFNKKE